MCPPHKMPLNDPSPTVRFGVGLAFNLKEPTFNKEVPAQLNSFCHFLQVDFLKMYLSKVLTFNVYALISICKRFEVSI